MFSTKNPTRRLRGMARVAAPALLMFAFASVASAVTVSYEQIFKVTNSTDQSLTVKLTLTKDHNARDRERTLAVGKSRKFSFSPQFVDRSGPSYEEWTLGVTPAGGAEVTCDFKIKLTKVGGAFTNGDIDKRSLESTTCGADVTFTGVNGKQAHITIRGTSSIAKAD